MWRCLSLALVCTLAACGSEPRPRSAILVVVDTLRADHLGSYGHRRATSPHLDARAAAGRVFEQAWATSSWTLPSFGSLYTGQLPSRHQAGLRIKGRRNFHRRLSRQFPTLAEILAERGFATGAIASNPYLHQSWGVARGFQDYDFVSVDNAVIRRAHVAVEQAQRWIGARGDQPFFLMLHLFDPHMNYDPHPDVQGRFTGDLASRLTLPIGNLRGLRSGAVELDDADVQFLGAAYDEEIAAVDQALEQLFAWMDERGLSDDCLVVFTSDHGEELFEHGGFEHGHAMWEELLHVPMIAWGPGVAAGRSSDPVSIADLMPTILEGLGVAPPADLYGISLWQHLTAAAPLPDRLIVAEGTTYGSSGKAIRRRDTKLIRRGQDEGALFDLGGDPGESRDLRAEQPGTYGELLELLMEHPARRPPAQQAPQADLDPQTEADLRALGYTK